MSNVKTGFLYYNSDTDRFKDIRIKRLKKDLGCDGFAVYEYLLNEIYRVQGCFLVWDESTAFDVAEYWGLKESKVNEIVRYCCAVGLFDKALLSNGNILTSPSIQSRYVEMCIRAKRKEIKIPEEYNIIPEECRIILEEYLKKQEVCRNSIKVYIKKPPKGGKEIDLNPIILDKPIQECYEELSSNSSWIESVVMNKRASGHLELNLESFQEYLKLFFDKLQNEGETHKSPKDGMAHFSRWLDIELNKPKPDMYKMENEELLASLSARNGSYYKFLTYIQNYAPYCFSNMRMPSEKEALIIRDKYGDAAFKKALRTLEGRVDIRSKWDVFYYAILKQFEYMNNGS
ncbi:DUF4373 domain-containing protein [Bacteroides finegoldii]|jgi:hypothetical protein|uniref:Asp-tRNAAsn/Glu-tRNAGln amidotransferase B subunit n=1 Tax=Bacteroides finegoldii TaxID=338188 RepID=A0A174JNZ9_9BACE|nr:DUF4373 domain-containing protein [Bacteroides finegoldii]CUO98895.1 Asp-tRNAAsn/Glu-tRNAGln amidotransferase B subunit [Bacteroides finegoldii]